MASPAGDISADLCFILKHANTNGFIIFTSLATNCKSTDLFVQHTNAQR